MPAEYAQLLDPMTGDVSSTILRTRDQAYIPDDPANRDRADFNQWLAEGNTPDPPPEPPPVASAAAAGEAVAAIERIEALEARVAVLERKV